MSYTKSNLSSAKYGYDYVVAVTEGSINATMKAYLSDLESDGATPCYYYDEDGEIKQISLWKIKEKTKINEYPDGVDPFAIPCETKISDPALKALSEIGFAYGFKAKIGIPPGYASANIPDVVALNPGAPGSVNFTLMCSDFTVVELTYGPRGATKWFSAEQKPGKAWLFTSKMDLKTFDVGADHQGKVPQNIEDIMNRMKGIDDSFSIQKMTFDFVSAIPHNLPTISGVDAGSQLYSCLQREFFDKYFKELKANEPVLAYAISCQKGQTGTFHTTGIKHQVNAYVDDTGHEVSQPTAQQQKNQTLCYLCATEGRSVPSPAQFDWNWIDDRSEAHGVLAINRITFSYFLAFALKPQIQRFCLVPNVTLTSKALVLLEFKWNIDYSREDPKFTYKSSGDEIFTYDWTRESISKINDLTSFHISTSLNVTAKLRGNQIILVRHLVVWCKISEWPAVIYGNAVDKTCTDTFDLSIAGNGTLELKGTNETKDNSKNLDVDGFSNFWLGNINSLLDNIQRTVQDSACYFNEPISLDGIQGFVFPGGNTFNFKSARFSDNQDLVAKITYVPPEQEKYLSP